MTSILALVLVAASKPDAGDYFPLKPGTTWVYEDVVDGLTSLRADRVGNAQSIEGTDAIPIVTTIRGRVDGSTFYRIEGGTVWVVAFEQNKPLDRPYPVLKAGSKRESWQHTGQTQWMGAPDVISIKGSSRPAGQRDVLGEKRETIEVTVEAQVGPNGLNLKSKQKSIYARGVGLVSTEETITVNKNKSTRKTTLREFKPADGG
ncbi:MAG: hypothetical protein KF884_01135 [Fimbriimonadaceae bacterium]|nr:hypothetical protein [Fimbriimonadaceae bacterium]QYK58700.1 MAG: hypothetical protein KF884_01135 [Fimbriimonadaceae bacterium]